MVVVIAALLLVFELDRTTASTPVQHLSYLPIIFAAFSFGTRGGLMAALAAIVFYHLANPHLFTFRYEESDSSKSCCSLRWAFHSETEARRATPASLSR